MGLSLGKIICLSAALCFASPSEASCLRKLGEAVAFILAPGSAKDILERAYTTTAEIDEALAHFKSSLRADVPWPFNYAVQKHTLASNARDYAMLKQQGKSHQEAMEAASTGFVEDYLALREAGVPHEEAKIVAKYDHQTKGSLDKTRRCLRGP